MDFFKIIGYLAILVLCFFGHVWEAVCLFVGVIYGMWFSYRETNQYLKLYFPETVKQIEELESSKKSD